MKKISVLLILTFLTITTLIAKKNSNINKCEHLDKYQKLIGWVNKTTCDVTGVSKYTKPNTAIVTSGTICGVYVKVDATLGLKVKQYQCSKCGFKYLSGTGDNHKPSLGPKSKRWKAKGTASSPATRFLLVKASCPERCFSYEEKHTWNCKG